MKSLTAKYARLANAQRNSLTQKLLASILGCSLLPCLASAQITINSTGSYGQDFDGLISSSTATWTDNSTITGWYAQRTGTGTTIAASDGTGTGGNLYSFGSTSSTDRALGSLGSGNAAAGHFAWGVAFQNTSVSSMNIGTLSYVGEQWRNSATSAQTVTVWYKISSSAITSLNPNVNTGWSSISALDFTSPITGGTAGALNGNSAANRTTKTTNLAYTLASGEYIMFRWSDPDHTGSDHGFAIDDFSLSYSLPSIIGRGAGTTFSASSFGGAAFTSLDTANFNGTSANISLSGSVVTAGLQFNTSGYTLSGGVSDSIVITGSTNVATDVTAEISGKITGASPLIKTGAGTLSLTNSANDFIGNVSIGAGTLQVASNGALGNTANDIALADGILKPSGNLTLGSGRDITGSGTIAIANGNTLSVTGTVNAATLILSDTGTLNLGGSGSTIGTLTINAPGVVNGNAFTLSTLSSSAFSGTAIVDNDLTIPTGNRTYDLVGNVALNGSITNSNSADRITKTGSGTLTVSGNLSGYLGGFRLGISNVVPVNGGTLAVASDNALGATTLQFNAGTLEAIGDRTFTNGLSIGGRDSVAATPTLSGGNMTFSGANTFFKSGGTSGQLRLDTQNTTTLSGDWTPSGGGGTATGITLGGNGRLVITGNATALTETITLADTITLQVNNTLGGGLTVASGTTLKGSGTISGPTTIQAGGTLAPGNSPGVLTFTGDLTLSGTTVMEINGTGRGTTYDGIDLTTGAGQDLAYGGTLSLLFGAPITAGTYDLFALTAGVAQTGTFGAVTIGGSAVASSSGLAITGAGWTASLIDTQITPATWSLAFDNATGDLTITPIPEPSAYAAIAGMGMIGFALYRRRKHTAKRAA